MADKEKDREGKGEKKSFLPEETRETLRERFADLKDEVVMEVFTKEGENDPYNGLTTVFCSEIASLSDKLEVRFHRIGEERSAELDVVRSPTVVFNADKYNIRYTGAPAGEEGRSFIETIFMVSLGESFLTPESKSALKELDDKRHVMVFVTPTCPYCPGQVVNAFRAAIERPDLVSAECVEATENIDLSKKFNVGSVPQTVVNEVMTTLLNVLPRM
jgi:thioredoxin reductase (NADPH)